MTDHPDPEAIYEAVKGFVSGRVPGMTEFAAPLGWRANGDHPAVIEHWKDGFFRLAPDDVIRRQGAELLEAIRSRASATAPPLAAEAPPIVPRGPGRPGWGRELFAKHWREAKARAASDRLADIAADFEALDGHFGLDPEYLGKLVHKWGQPIETPE